MSDRSQTLVAEAVAAEGRRDWAQAQALYAAALADDPLDLRALVRIAAVELALGRPADAAQRYAAAGRLRPDVAPLAYNEALAHVSAEAADAALAALARALALDPRYVDAHLARAATLRALGRHAEVVDHGQAALAAGVDSAELAAEHGLALAATGRHEAAIRRFGDSVRQGGDTHEMRFQAGCSELALDNAKAALAAFDGALAGRPDWVEAGVNRAIALSGLGRYDESLAACTALLERGPRVDLLRTAGRALQSLQRYDEAVDRLRAALELDVNDHESWEALATVYSEANVSGPLLLHCVNEALRTWVGGTPGRDAVRVRLLSIRVGALYAVMDMDEAERTVDELVALAADFPLAIGHQAFSHSANLDWVGFEERRARLIEGVRANQPVTTPFQFLPQCDDAALQRQCAEYYMALVHPTLPPLSSPADPTQPKIRIGYLSADFRDHPVAHLLAATLEAHDRDRFEVYAFSSHLVNDADATTVRIKRAVDRFELLSAVSNDEAARRIRAAGIDILVELNGLTAGERPGIAAARPAPIQVNFLGYPGTVGAAYLDYVIADAGVIPPGAEGHYTEHVVRLPAPFLPPGDARTSDPSPGRDALGLAADAIVLAAFHSGFKLSPDLFGVWMRLLQAAPTAVLWMSVVSERARQRVRAAATQAGIDDRRIVFAERIPSRAEHLARLGEADLLLDTLTYNSHSSALDALWCGVPILTARGSAFASRVCGSLLDVIGLGETVAESLADYEQRALALVQNPAQLRALRDAVRAGVIASGLYDCVRHTRRLEAAYEQMHARRLQGEPPASFDVSEPVPA
jgi:protein O-GlcNAc transferase